MTEEKFKEMCVNHDLTYDYSDDHSVWVRGTASLSAIQRAADELGKDKAIPIWNSVVDSKIAEDYRSQFYWGE